MILDLGCGTGRDTVHLGIGGATVIGVDAAFSGLELAREKQSTNCAPVYTASMAQYLPFPNNRFDGVYCFGLLHEFVGTSANDNVERAMREIHRVLKPSGILALMVLAGDP